MGGRHQLPPAALRARRIGAAVAPLVMVAVALALDVGVRRAADIGLGSGVPVGVGPLAFLVVVAAAIWWWTALVHASWYYELSDDRLSVHHGVLNERLSVVPRNRVQQVTTDQGPLQRWLGLMSVTVHTAGARTPNVHIPLLEEATAEGLRTVLIPHGRPDTNPNP